jgi:hypothetical protein
MCVQTAVIMEPSMWPVSAIQFKETYGPQLKQCMCTTAFPNGILQYLEHLKGGEGSVVVLCHSLNNCCHTKRDKISRTMNHGK